MKVRSKLVAKPINQQIETMKSQGKEIIVIDDWVITTHEDLYPRLNKIYYVERQFSERREGLKERDDLTLEELKVADEFWDFLCTKGTYNELLKCFEEVGMEMRNEIDTYFEKFRTLL